MSDGDEEPMLEAVILDLGSNETKAGFAGDEGPAEVLSVSPGAAPFDRIKAALEALEVEATDFALILSEQPGTSEADRGSLARRLFDDL